MDIDRIFALVVEEGCKMMSCDRATLFLRGVDEHQKPILWSYIAKGMPKIVVPLKATSIAGAYDHMTI